MLARLRQLGKASPAPSSRPGDWYLTDGGHFENTGA